MSEEFVLKTPPEYTSLFKEGRCNEGIQKAIREFQSNAANYRANTSGAFVGCTPIDGKVCDVLWFHHNGEGWESPAHIKEALRPLACAQRAAAFAGLGLGAASFMNASLATGPMLFTGGWIGDKFHLVKMYQVPGGRLAIEEAPEMVKEYTKLVGNTLLRKKDSQGRRLFSVVYGVKLQPIPLDTAGKNAGKKRPPLSRPVMSALQFYSSSLFGLQVSLHYCQPVIGFNHNKQADRVRFASLESVEWGRNSATYRRLYPRSEYAAKFLVKSYTIPTVPFDFGPEEDVVGTVDAEVVLGFYQNVKKSSTYCCNIRNVEGNRDGDIGLENEGGEPPNLKAVMAFPLLHDEMIKKYPQYAHSYERFLDNALSSHQHISLLAGKLGLQFEANCKSPAADLSKFDPSLKPLPLGEVYTQTPTLTFEIRIKGFSNVRNAKTGEPLDYPAEAFASKFHRTGDFWLANDQLARQLMVEVVTNTRPNMDTHASEAFELSKILFPVDITEGVKIHLGLFTEESKKRRAGSREAKCTIYHLDGDELLEGKVEIKPGGRKPVVIQDNESLRLLRAAELTRHPSCRGLDFKDSTKTPDELDESVLDRINELSELLGVSVKDIPIVTLAVERTKHNGRVIPKNEWVPNNGNYSPSRNLITIWSGLSHPKRFNLGIVVDLPKSEKSRDGIDPGDGDHEKKGKKRKSSVITKGGEQGEFNPLCQRHKEISFLWDDTVKRIRINSISDFGSRYYCHPCQTLSVLDIYLNRLWLNFQTIAQAIYEHCEKIGYTIADPSKLPDKYHKDAQERLGFDSDEGHQPWDSMINTVLEEMIFGSRTGKDTEVGLLLQKIDKYLSKTEVEITEEVETK